MRGDDDSRSKRKSLGGAESGFKLRSSSARKVGGLRCGPREGGVGWLLSALTANTLMSKLLTLRGHPVGGAGFGGRGSEHARCDAAVNQVKVLQHRTE